jgi:collagenase-like PrtC family protease
MKRAEYVATVTRVYREAINAGFVTALQVSQLLTAFNRQGFTDGYFMGKPGKEMFGIRTEKGDDPKWIKEAQQTYEGTDLLARCFCHELDHLDGHLYVDKTEKFLYPDKDGDYYYDED